MESGVKNFSLQIRVIYLILIVFTPFFIRQGLNAATFEFSSPSSKLVLGDYNGGGTQAQGYFKNTAMSKLIGFDQQSIVRGNSQANTFSNAWTFSVGTGMVAGGATVSTKNITRDLVVTNSEMSRVVRTTSNWVNAKSAALLATSNTVNNLFPIVRGSSQWIANNNVSIRGTSNWVAKQAADFGASTLGRQLRGTSNWANSQVTDFGGASIGRQLRGTSNWANSQVVDLGNAGVGRNLRTTTNWVAKQAADFGASTLGMQLRGTSNWVNAKSAGLLATSNVVNNLFPIVRGSSQWIANNNVSIRGTSNWVANNGPRVLQGTALSSLTVSTATYNLTAAIRLGTRSSLVFTSNCVFDGGGNDIIMQPGSTGVINVGAYNVTFKNVRFVNFSLSNLLVTLATGLVTFGDGTQIEFAQNESLPTASITNMQFTGNVRLNGKGQWLDLTNTASLTIGGHRSSLMLDNITIKNLRGTMLRSLDADSTVSLKNTVLKMSSTYTFTQGHLEVVGDTTITGDSQIFSFETPQTSSICSRVMLTVDRNTTFSYSPYSSTRKDLIWMPDITSVMFLNGATLKTTRTGIQFKRGTLLADGKVHLYNDSATRLSEAIVFGNGVAINDANISIMPAASINLKSGVIDYRNAS